MHFFISVNNLFDKWTTFLLIIAKYNTINSYTTLKQVNSVVCVYGWSYNTVVEAKNAYFFLTCPHVFIVPRCNYCVGIYKLGFGCRSKLRPLFPGIIENIRTLSGILCTPCVPALCVHSANIVLSELNEEPSRCSSLTLFSGKQGNVLGRRENVFTNTTFLWYVGQMGLGSGHFRDTVCIMYYKLLYYYKVSKKILISNL